MTATQRSAAMRLASLSPGIIAVLDATPAVELALACHRNDGGLDLSDARFSLADYGRAFMRTFPVSAKRYRKAARRLVLTHA